MPVTVDVLVIVPGVVIVVVHAYVHDSPTSNRPLPLASPPVYTGLAQRSSVTTGLAIGAFVVLSLVTV